MRSPTRTARIRPVEPVQPPACMSAGTNASSTSGRESQSIQLPSRILRQSSGRHKSTELSPALFRLVWISVVVVSVVISLYAAILAVVYYGAMVIRGGYMIEGSGLLALQHIPIVVAGYAFLAVVFGFLGLQAIVASIRARRLLFKSLNITQTPPTSSKLGIRRRFLQWWHALFADGGPLEMSPETFEFVFLVREIVEVTTQSYQAYKCSKLISQPWINNFYVGTLVLNCWIAPVIHFAARDRPALQRFLYLCSDVVLDFVSTLVVPLCIIFSIVLNAFSTNMSLAGGDMEYAFDVPTDDVTFMNTLKAVQQVFVVSWIDFVTKMLPFYSMASCMSQIKRHVQPKPIPLVKTVPSSVVSTGSLLTVSPGRHSSHFFSMRVQKTIDASRKVRQRVQWICQTRLVKWLISVKVVHSIFIVWGVLLLAFHIKASLVAHATPTEMATMGCKSSSSPWFVHQYSCTILEINCYRHRFDGHASEIASVLGAIDAGGVSSLIISHCPRLSVPAIIQGLINLVGLEIYNSTIVTWGQDAALVNSKLPSLQYLSLLRVNMSELPVGVQAVDFPTRLRDIVIASSNLSTLPPDLHTQWHRLLNLYVEDTLIDSFPSTLAMMKPDRMSLLGNRINLIEDEAFPFDSTLQVISVAMNPISKWPKQVGDTSNLYLVLMDYTQIAELPDWLVAEGERRARTMAANITVSAGGSRYCENLHGSIHPMPGLSLVCRAKQIQEIAGCPLDSYYSKARVP